MMVQIKQLRYLNKEEVGLNLAPTYYLLKPLISSKIVSILAGLTQEEAGKWCYGKSDDIFNSYLNDPASIDTILEEIRGF